MLNIVDKLFKTNQAGKQSSAKQKRTRIGDIAEQSFGYESIHVADIWLRHVKAIANQSYCFGPQLSYIG